MTTLGLRDLGFLAAAKTPSFTPANITTALWLDAADSATVTQSSNLISQVNDKSGNSRHFTASGTARPTYTSNSLNGLPVFTFSGAQRLTSASAASTWIFLHANQSTIWLVVKTGNSADPLTTYGYLGTNEGSSARTGRGICYYDDASLNNRITDFCTEAGTMAPIIFDNSQNNSISPNTTSLISVVGDATAAAAANRSLIRVNGGTAIANNEILNPVRNSFSPSFNLQIGDLGNSNVPLVGYIAELVVQASAADTQTVQLVEGYLAHKWGLTASLPSGHPYKSTAPTI